MLARHYTTGGYAAAIFPLGEYGPLKCFSVQLCVRAESILASYLLAKEIRSPKSGIGKNPHFFPNHTPTLTILKYRYPNPDPDLKTKRLQKSLQKSLQKIFLSVELPAEITFISNIVSPMGERRRLEALTDNSSKFQDHRKHLSPSSITPTLTLTLLKYPYPNLNLIQKLKLSVKFSGAGAGPAGPAAAVPIFSLKKKDVCLIGRLLVVFARLVERGLFVMEDPEH